MVPLPAYCSGHSSRLGATTVGWEGYHESRRCSRNTYPESDQYHGIGPTLDQYQLPGSRVTRARHSRRTRRGSASQRRWNNLTGLKGFTCKPRPECGRDCLICATIDSGGASFLQKIRRFPRDSSSESQSTIHKGRAQYKLLDTPVLIWDAPPVIGEPRSSVTVDGWP